MKKTILAIFMAAVVSLFTTSCSKTSMNTSKLIGTWKVVSASQTYQGKTETQALTGSETIQFVKGGSFIASESSGSHTESFNGTWAVVDDSLILASSGGISLLNTTWHIDALDSQSLVVSTTMTISQTVSGMTVSTTGAASMTMTKL